MSVQPGLDQNAPNLPLRQIMTGMRLHEVQYSIPDLLQGQLHRLRKDAVFLILFALLLLLSLIAPDQITHYPGLVDWPTIATLTGLLILTKALELSKALDWLGHKLIGQMATERATALCLVITAALLSTLLTNDVALFVVVPLTLGICRMTKMPATRLIIFEALAVNAGSALTPVGNPQNIFLWQQSNVSFGAFVLHMLPLVAVLMALLLIVTACAFGKRPLKSGEEQQQEPIDRQLLGISLALYLPFLLATNWHVAGWAVGALLLIFIRLRPTVLALLDWGLLLVFMLMFIDLRLVAGLEVVRAGMHELGLEQSRHLYLSAIAFSQLVSNVPAAIALLEYSADWRVISYGVNIGGFGLVLGSMANLIALRMAGERKAWLQFHFFALPFLGIATAVGYLLLFRGTAA